MTEPWTLEQAEEEIADLRGQVDRLTEIIATVTLTVTGTLTAPDASVWSSTGLAMGAGAVITADTWHTLGSLSHFTVARGRYRLTPEGELEIDISVTPDGANAVATSFANTLPAACQPDVDLRVPAATTRAVTAADAWHRVYVGGSSGANPGTVQVITAVCTNPFDASFVRPLS